MNRAGEALRLVCAALGGVGICLFIMGKVGATSPAAPADERGERSVRASAVALESSPRTIAASTGSDMALRRAEGLAYMDAVAERGTLQRGDSRALRRLYRDLDAGGRKAMRVAFHDAFNDGRIVVDDPTLFPF